jgi:hypothetical protein
MFMAVNAVAGTQLPRPEALAYAIGGAVSVGLSIVGIQVLRREPLRRATYLIYVLQGLEARGDGLLPARGVARSGR